MLAKRRKLGAASFSEYILKDPIDKGSEGTKFLDEFRKSPAKIRNAVLRMIEEADTLAKKSQGTGDDKLNKIFADLED